MLSQIYTLEYYRAKKMNISIGGQKNESDNDSKLKKVYTKNKCYIIPSKQVKLKVTESYPTLCDPHGLYSQRNSPGQNTGVGSLSLFQRIFPTQGSNPSLPAEPQRKPKLKHS